MSVVTFGDEETDRLAEQLLNGPVDNHAGNTEISIMLAAYPEITKKPTSDSPKKCVSFDWDKPVIDVTVDGVIDSHPKWVANEKIGRKLIKIYSDNLIRKIKQVI